MPVAVAQLGLHQGQWVRGGQLAAAKAATTSAMPWWRGLSRAMAAPIPAMSGSAWRKS